MTTTAIASIPSREHSTHLSTQQQRALRTSVVDRLRALQDRAAQNAGALEQFTSSDSPHEREIVRDTLQNLLAGMREHESALGRFESGTYGVCSVCARPIPFERLEAIPEANHCVGCVRLT